jgi:hypothetical protein
MVSPAATPIQKTPQIGAPVRVRVVALPGVKTIDLGGANITARG